MKNLHLEEKGLPNCRSYFFPENNKHPKEQMQWVRDLIAKERTQEVIITTQSDWIIRELNNILMLGKTGLIDGLIGYTSEHLNFTEQEVKMFILGEDGGCQSAKTDEFGFTCSAFDDAIIEANNNVSLLGEKLTALKERDKK